MARRTQHRHGRAVASALRPSAARQLATDAWFATEVRVTVDEKALGIWILDALEAAARLREGWHIEVLPSGHTLWVA